MENRSRRILAEFLGVAVGGALAVGVGAVIGCGVDTRNCSEGAPLGMVAVGVFAIPGGVVAAGALLHGNGGYGWALLGEFAGLALAVPLATVVRSTLAAGLILGVLPVVGTVTAYELTSDVVAPVPPPTDRPAVTPSVALGPHGAVLGLGGRF